jgi:ESCRT-II complex subunit VPS25
MSSSNFEVSRKIESWSEAQRSFLSWNPARSVVSPNFSSLVYWYHSIHTLTIHKFPEFYQFPPFFTIQPVLATREKQLALWRELLLNYHTHHKLKTLVVHDCVLWKNEQIHRQLSPSDILLVVQDFVQHGHAEWVDPSTQTHCRILWRQPEQLATDIYQWAEQKGYLNSVCTLYELHSGEDVNGMSFQGADEELLRRSLAILEQRGKCAVFKGETSSEDGIKFF